VSEAVVAALDPPARQLLAEWFAELGPREEHLAWLEVVSFTDGLPRRLERKGELSAELSSGFRAQLPAHRRARRAAADPRVRGPRPRPRSGGRHRVKRGSVHPTPSSSDSPPESHRPPCTPGRAACGSR
jgi:hypothetical protein